MYAVVRTGGKQYKVAKDSVLKVESLTGDVGSKLDLEVLMLGGDKPQIGAAVVSDPRPRVPMPSSLRPEASVPPSFARIAPSIRAIGEGIAGSTPIVLCG